MSSNKPTRPTNASDAIEASRDEWRELYKVMAGLIGSPYAGATALPIFRDLLEHSSERLLQLGLDVSDPRQPRVVPVPVARHPKTRRETHEWEAEIRLQLYQFTYSFSAAGVGAHVVYSAVGDEPLTDVLAKYVRDPAKFTKEDVAALISKRNLECLALACSLWLFEPTGPMKAAARELDAACFARILYAMELNPLISNYNSATDKKMPEGERAVAAQKMAGWSLANLSLRGQAGGTLRRALGEKLPYEDHYKRLFEELPSASLVAWKTRAPEEPLRSTGKREMNLARRVAALIEKTAKPKGETELTEAPRDDELLQDFEMREDARRKLNELEATAGLSPQQKEVWQRLRAGEEIPEIAAELGMSRNQVDVQKHKAVAKLKRAAGL